MDYSWNYCAHMVLQIICNSSLPSFTYLTLKHSINLVNSDGIHINSMEGLLESGKKLIRKCDAGFTTAANLEL